MKDNRIYHPPVNFEEALTGFISFLLEAKIAMSVANPVALQRVSEEQTMETAQRLKVERDHHLYAKGFEARQAGRFAEFMKALALTRALYRDDPAMLRALDRFKSHRGSRRKPANGGGTESPPTASADAPVA